MDCDTTGIEPDLALVKYKKLVGGGMIKIVNQTVPQSLIKLGYTPDQVEAIVSHIDATGTIEGAPALKPEHLPVFDCSFRPANGTRTIHYTGHLKMMGAVQPFTSGAISKTINMPEESTVEDVMEAYIESWRLGPQGCRHLSRQLEEVAAAQFRHRQRREEGFSLHADQQGSSRDVEKIVYRPVRRKLADERTSITHKFSIAGHEGYITVGLYPDGTPGELFIRMAKEGSTIARHHGQLRDLDQLLPPVRRAAEVPGCQVRPRAFRADGLDRQPADPLREVDPGLHLPLDGPEIHRTGVRSHRGWRAAGSPPHRRKSAGIAALCGSGHLRRPALRRMRWHDDPQRQLL